MKKRVLVVLLVAIAFLTACGSGKEADKSTRTFDDLMNAYISGFTKANIKEINSIYAPYYLKKFEDSMTQDSLDEALKDSKEEYGDDFNITYEVTKTTKLTEEELKEFNDAVKKYFETEDEASECYKYEGTITFKGSKRVDDDSLSYVGYCNYNGSWYLVDYD